MKLGNLTEDAFARLVRAAFDIALVLDKEGVIEDISVRKAELLALGCQSWIGLSWASTVTSESRVKVQEMLLAAQNVEEELRWRHVNHGMDKGVDLPVQYAVLKLGDDGRVLALGRDMEAIAVLQRRLIETQQSIERDYLRLRHIETKYRILFETGNEAVLLVDGLSFRVLDANSSAQAFVKDSHKKLVGRDVTDCFEAAYREEIQSLLRMAHATGRIEMCRARFVGASGDCTVSASVFRQESGPHFLMRLLPHGMVARPTLAADQQLLFSEALEHSPDGFVSTDRAGVIKSANAELMTMLGVTALSQLYGQPLENWLVRGGVDWGVLLTNLRSQTVVKDFATELRVMAGSTIAVEISALTLNTDQAYYAFYIRDVERIRVKETPVSGGMVSSVAELSKLVGRMPMRDIVGETVDMIEKMCIQSALELTRNNRASAAEMLGLSRQSLYVKLRRFEMVSDMEVSSIH
ncbi:MAG: transcriptional regulator PpsR [Rhodoferax ferrireducens]|uniref:Transcriptional regulator PpsR n=1 Tax=Rhodoferax ferrireducens TaxID=192843 RepID=A0A1W9KZ32_9BURK|nr:MAG: transcriptional regulator PpsR [Rhodoferax ferrireducens]